MTQSCVGSSAREYATYEHLEVHVDASTTHTVTCICARQKLHARELILGTYTTLAPTVGMSLHNPCIATSLLHMGTPCYCMRTPGTTNTRATSPQRHGLRIHKPCSVLHGGSDGFRNGADGSLRAENAHQRTKLDRSLGDDAVISRATTARCAIVHRGRQRHGSRHAPIPRYPESPRHRKGQPGTMSIHHPFPSWAYKRSSSLSHTFVQQS